MKKSLIAYGLGLLLGLVLLFALAFGVASLTSSVAAKEKNKTDLITSADLDHAFVQGATVKYQLLDEEILGAPLVYSNGTIVRRMNAVITIDYTAIDVRRDAQGRKLFRVRIDRPDFLGGQFEKDAPFDSSRAPGSIDSLQPGDLVN